jgi:transposase-like protein
LDRHELLAAMQDSLDRLAVELGLLVANAILEDEVARLCGRRYERQASREYTRHGHQRGVATLVGQELPIERPRVRRADCSGEVALETYARLQSNDAMPQAVLRRMVRGVSTRDYGQVIDTAREGFGVARSSVSRGFVQASAADVKALAERQLAGERFAAIMIDGVEYAGETMIVAPGITAEGAKRILGVRQGATEYAEVCTSLLEDLCRAGWTQGEPHCLCSMELGHCTRR